MRGGSASVEKALEELYGSDPSTFTKKRDAIAKELKAQGDDEAASTVRARRKPTQIAWVLNQLARRYPDDVAELVDVGRELAREQRKALRGEAGASFRESIERQRKVIGGVTRRTADLMKDLGVDPSGHLDEIAAALQAALVDPSVGAQLEEGRLEKPPEAAAGFAGPSGTISGSTQGRSASVQPPARRPRKGGARAERPRPSRRAEMAARKREEARERAERQAQALAQKRALAKERADREAAKRAEKKAVAALRAAEREAEKRRKEALKAEEEARKAIERAKELARTADESERRVAEAKRQLARADGR